MRPKTSRPRRRVRRSRWRSAEIVSFYASLIIYPQPTLCRILAYLSHPLDSRDRTLSRLVSGRLDDDEVCCAARLRRDPPEWRLR